MLNTNGMKVEAKGIQATMNYHLNPYFNFNPPLRFQKLQILTNKQV